MTELEVQEGALPLLESLQMLCKDLDGICGTIIQSLQRIKEVSLHDGVSDQIKHKWKEAAKKHPRHPKLLFVKMAEEVGVGSESAENSESPVVPYTDTMLSVEVPYDAISIGESVQVNGDGLQHDDEKEDTDNIDMLDDFASKTCLDPLMNKESFEQEIEGVVGLEDQEMEGVAGLEDQEMEGVVGLEDQKMKDVTKTTDQADKNLVLLVVGENRRKRARTVSEGNSMDKVVDRAKRKNPEDVPETRPTQQTTSGLTVVVPNGK